MIFIPLLTTTVLLREGSARYMQAITNYLLERV